VNQIEVMQGSKNGSVRTKPLFWKSHSAWPARKSKPDHWISYAVVHGQWKLVTNHDGSYKELYKIVADPFEKINLSKTKEEEVVRLTALIEGWKKSLPARPSGEVFSALRQEKK
jgi:N-acetylgalactosamine-6-sulfatase